MSHASAWESPLVVPAPWYRIVPSFSLTSRYWWNIMACSNLSFSKVRSVVWVVVVAAAVLFHVSLLHLGVHFVQRWKPGAQGRCGTAASKRRVWCSRGCSGAAETAADSGQGDMRWGRLWSGQALHPLLYAGQVSRLLYTQQVRQLLYTGQVSQCCTQGRWVSVVHRAGESALVHWAGESMLYTGQVSQLLYTGQVSQCCTQGRWVNVVHRAGESAFADRSWEFLAE